jgi:hypothetical protein
VQVCEDDLRDTIALAHRAMEDGGYASLSIDYGSREGGLQAMLGATMHVVSKDFTCYTFVVGCSDSPGRHRQADVRRGLEALLVKLQIPWSRIIGLMHDAGSNMDVRTVALVCLSFAQYLCHSTLCRLSPTSKR